MINDYAEIYLVTNKRNFKYCNKIFRRIKRKI